MQFKKLFLLFITPVVVIGLLGLSIWYWWNTDQKLAQQRIPTLTPITEFNHGAPQIEDVAISPVNSDMIASVGTITSDTFTSNGEDSVLKAWDPRDNKGSMIKIWNRNNTKNSSPNADRPSRQRLHRVFGNGVNGLSVEILRHSCFGMQLQGLKIDVFDIPSGAAAFSPNGHLLATASNDIKLWDIRNLKDIKAIVVLPPKMRRQPLSHEEARSVRHHNETSYERYNLVDFSSDGKWIAAGGSMDDVDWQISRGVVKVWDLQRRQLVKIFPRELPKGKNHSNIRSISFSPDNRFFASVSSYGYTIWTLPEWHIHCDVRAQTASEPISFTLDDGTQIGTGVGQPVQFFQDLAFSPDGKIYAVAESRTVTLYSTKTVTPIALLKGGRYLDVVTFSQDGNTLVGGGSDGVVPAMGCRRDTENKIVL